MPPGVQQWPDDSLERRAYRAVEDVPVVETNDTNRLGYHVFLFLKGELGSIEEAVHVAQPRMLIDKDDAVRRIANALEEGDGNDAV
ncbi:MAG: hypothetical protein C0600_13730 [Ignavibacteria bacterium]|nr:MAG: hypothetical protein C0600_13730 [Ignavibacteria bacterium]